MPVSKNRRKNGKVKKYNPKKNYSKVLDSAVTQMVRTLEKNNNTEATAVVDEGSVTIVPPSVGASTSVQNENT